MQPEHIRRRFTTSLALVALWIIFLAAPRLAAAQDDGSAVTRMQLTERGRRTRARLLVTRRMQRSRREAVNLVRFLELREIAGAGLLGQDKADGGSEQSLYMPAIDRVRRIAGERKGGRFVGSDLYFEDLQACGACHLMNFGGFASPERRLVFDINDFDEVSVASWEWDVLRLAASFVIAGRANGFRDEDCRESAWTAAQSYRRHMIRYAEMPVLEAYYESIDLKRLLLAEETDEEMRALNRKRIRKAERESAHLKEYTRLAVETGGEPRIRDEPPLIFHDTDIARQAGFREMVERMLAEYAASLPPERRLLFERYRLADIAMKVVGVGSVGTYCGIALMVSGNGDPLFLQYKEARPSVLEPHCGRLPFAHDGERVVFGQRLLQASADIFLGWTTGGFTGRHFYVRQLRDAKIKPTVEIMKPANLRTYAKACGWALARAHKRTACVNSRRPRAEAR